LSNTVFILGAGASAEGGAPLMGNFLEVAQNLMRSGAVSDSAEHFNLVQKGRALLLRTHSRADCIDVHNLEAVFSAFEMARMIHSLGDMTVPELEQLPNAYRAVIGRVLDRTLEFRSNGSRLIPPSPYKQFVDVIRKGWARADRQLPTIITFNYDIAIDYALHVGDFEVDYGRLWS
jgi:hypothetical protein